jgi:hypothetical protein
MIFKISRLVLLALSFCIYTKGQIFNKTYLNSQSSIQYNWGVNLFYLNDTINFINSQFDNLGYQRIYIGKESHQPPK